jgi:hypothetical protein
VAWQILDESPGGTACMRACEFFLKKSCKIQGHIREPEGLTEIQTRATTASIVSRASSRCVPGICSRAKYMCCRHQFPWINSSRHHILDEISVSNCKNVFILHSYLQSLVKLTLLKQILQCTGHRPTCNNRQRAIGC